MSGALKAVRHERIPGHVFSICSPQPSQLAYPSQGFLLQSMTHVPEPNTGNTANTQLMSPNPLQLCTLQLK